MMMLSMPSANGRLGALRTLLGSLACAALVFGGDWDTLGSPKVRDGGNVPPHTQGKRLLQICIDNYGTLTERLSNVEDGEQVTVCPGDVKVDGEMAVSSSNVSLVCAEASKECALDGQGLHRILAVSGGNFTMIGITLRNGNAFQEDGGGLKVTGRGGAIFDCSFENNAARNGGGLYFSPSEGTGSIDIRSTIFSGNSANGGRGGAGYIHNLGTEACEVGGSNNVATDRTCIRDADVLRRTLNQNSIDGKTIVICDSTTLYTNEIEIPSKNVTLTCAGESPGSCVLDGQNTNRILNVGGAYFTLRGITLRNGEPTEGNGGAMILTGGGWHKVENSVFAENIAFDGGGLYFSPQTEDGKISIRNTNFIGNIAYNYGAAANVPVLVDSYGNGGMDNKAFKCKGFFLREGGASGTCLASEPLTNAPTVSPRPTTSPRPSPPPSSSPRPTTNDGSKSCIRDAEVLARAFLNAADGATVRLCARTTIATNNPMNVSSSGVSVICPDADSGSCVLDGQQTHRLFHVTGSSFTLRGVKLQNGQSEENGGAMVLFGNGHKIVNCVLDGNEAGANGGGIYCDGQVEIAGTSFLNNFASGTGGAGYVNFLVNPTTTGVGVTGYNNRADRQCQHVYVLSTGLCVNLYPSSSTRGIRFVTEGGNTRRRAATRRMRVAGRKTEQSVASVPPAVASDSAVDIANDEASDWGRFLDMSTSSALGQRSGSGVVVSPHKCTSREVVDYVIPRLSDPKIIDRTDVPNGVAVHELSTEWTIGGAVVTGFYLEEEEEED